MKSVDTKLAGLALEANEAHARAQDCFSRGVEHATRAGKALVKAKAQLGHGEWGRWLSDNFRGSERTAGSRQLYMPGAPGRPRERGHHPELCQETRALQRVDTNGGAIMFGST